MVNATELNRQIHALEIGEVLCLENIPDQLYHQSPGIGSTAMKQASISLAHYHQYTKPGKTISPQTQAIFDFGSATHSLVLEPHLFPKQYVQMPDGMSKRGKEYDTFKSRHLGKTLLPYDVYNHVQNMRDVLYGVPHIKTLLTGDRNELSYWLKHPSGLMLKARLDSQYDDVGVDLKTTWCAKPHAFLKTVKDDYWVQIALYRLVSGVNDFVYIGIEKTPPYGWTWVYIDEEFKRLAELRLIKLMTKLANAICSGIYPGYDNDNYHQTKLTNYEQDELYKLEMEAA